ncbi:MAG: IS701 family transposase, partial [Candidatus Sericytochromatia bacterium]|nr:IS701 family transposase [Candidatus Tanganyikabacteria bacterium]
MAALVDAKSTSARHQSLLHFVGKAPWSDDAVMEAAFEHAIRPMVGHGPISAWLVDDTGHRKQGTKSVGVSRQYCGQSGKVENCQVAVTLSLANETASLPVGYRLYLPEAWANDSDRRMAAGVPDDVSFQPKWQIALGLIDKALSAGRPRAPVGADAGYGNVFDFRAGLTERGLLYIVGIESNTSVWPPGHEPPPPPPYSGRGRPPARPRRDDEHHPVSVLELARSLGTEDYTEVTWREGTKGDQRSRFAAVRVRPSHRDDRRDPHPEEWLLIEWPAGEEKPTKYWLSTLSAELAIAELVFQAKLRWRIERDFLELKDELGLDHYEGRGWRGFHHHASLCIATYAFLVAERALFSPLSPRGGEGIVKMPALPRGYRPRGASPHPAPSADVHRHDQDSHRPGAAPRPRNVPGLSPAELGTKSAGEDSAASQAFMTQ